MSGTYRTIVADPPWHYDGFVHGLTAGWRKRVANGEALCSNDEITRKQMPYTTMTLAEIAALPVAELAAKDAALFLWTTNKYLPASFGIVEDWGFSYTQLLVWSKINPAPFGGSVAPNGAEYLLVCKRGEHRWIGRLPASVITTERLRHSQKPEAFLDYIEGISPAPWLELFARRQRLGWDTWGNEAFDHVELSA